MTLTEMSDAFQSGLIRSNLDFSQPCNPRRHSTTFITNAMSGISLDSQLQCAAPPEAMQRMLQPQNSIMPSQDEPMLESQDRPVSQQIFPRSLALELTQMPSQEVLGTQDFSTPVEQQFQVDIDVSATQQDTMSSKSPAHSPVRYSKRPRHLAALDPDEATSQPSQSQSRSQAEPSTSSKATSETAARLPPCPPGRGRSRLGRPAKPLAFRNPFVPGAADERPTMFDVKSHNKHQLVSRMHTEFNVGAQIGKGNYSYVFYAVNCLDGMEYAIKRTKLPVQNDADRNRWLQEVQALALVQGHPNIVRYYSAWAEANGDRHGAEHLCIQMELCGPNLAQRARGGAAAAARADDTAAVLDNAGPFAAAAAVAATAAVAPPGSVIKRPPERVEGMREAELVSLLKQLAGALAHIHGRGLVHLDLKPDNIYRDLANPDMYKLGDFGLATSKSGLWRVQEGDSRYCPHELLNNDYSQLDKADIFALGATLYELAKGEPLPANGPLYDNIRRGKLALIPAVSETFRRVLRSLMHENPKYRPTAQALLDSELLTRRKSACLDLTCTPPSS